MIQIKIGIDEGLYKLAQDSLQHLPKAAGKALARAVNRALEGARTDAIKKICAEYSVRPVDVRKTLHIVRATPEKPEAHILSSGSAIPLIKFRVSPSKPPQQKHKKIGERKNVVAGVKFGTATPFPYSFVAKVGNGHVGVFSRVAGESLPIKQKWGPSVPQMLGSEAVLKYIEEQAKGRLEKELRHQINYLFGGGR